MDHEIKKSMVMTVLVMMGSPREHPQPPAPRVCCVIQFLHQRFQALVWHPRNARLLDDHHLWPRADDPKNLTSRISTSKSIGFYWHLFTTTNIHKVRLDAESGDQELLPASRSDASMFFPEASVTSSSPLRANLMVASWLIGLFEIVPWAAMGMIYGIYG